MERRTFLKMLGVGAGSVLVEPALLLGANPAALVAPTQGLAKSWVVYSGSGFGSSEAAIFAKEYVVSPQFTKGVDPHEVFYKASLVLQKRLGDETFNQLMAIPEQHRHHVEVITTVFMPIHTRTKHCFATAAEAAKLRDEDWEGFDVVADCAIQVKGYGMREKAERGERFGSGWVPPKGTDIYSTTGEYPVQLPTTLDLGHMMSISNQFVSDAGMQRRVGRILLAS